jgi:hypothetical protein
MAPQPTKHPSPGRQGRSRSRTAALAVTGTIVAVALVVLWPAAEPVEPARPPSPRPASGPEPALAGETVAGRVAPGLPAATPPRHTAAAPTCRSGQGLEVRSAAQLRRALRAARPGSRIRLADGVFGGEFVAKRSGLPTRRITLCGSRKAILRGRSLDHGYVFHLEGASYWTLSGFSVTGGQKGIVADRSSFNRLRDLAVYDVGQEGVHFRTFSADNLLERSEIHHTGRRDGRSGEGVYVGSAHGNWCRYSGCRPDASNRNRIVGNRIGPDTTAESVDLKEGTTAGVVRANTFVGMNMTDADSWVDVKGNRYSITGNRGTGALRDGFQVHVEQPGWGRGNLFAGNVAVLQGGEYGFRIDSDADGTIVRCDNRVVGARKGLSNRDCRR